MLIVLCIISCKYKHFMTEFAWYNYCLWIINLEGQDLDKKWKYRIANYTTLLMELYHKPQCHTIIILLHE